MKKLKKKNHTGEKKAYSTNTASQTEQLYVEELKQIRFYHSVEKLNLRQIKVLNVRADKREKQEILLNSLAQKRTF